MRRAYLYTDECGNCSKDLTFHRWLRRIPIINSTAFLPLSGDQVDTESTGISAAERLYDISWKCVDEDAKPEALQEDRDMYFHSLPEKGGVRSVRNGHTCGQGPDLDETGWMERNAAVCCVNYERRWATNDAYTPQLWGTLQKSIILHLLRSVISQEIT